MTNNKRKQKILFLLKKNLSSGGYSGTGAGLLNSCKFLAESLVNHRFVKEVDIVICVDGNSVDKELAFYKPDICIIEAFWITPEKLQEIQKLHKDVVFIVRVHSNIPFIAHEGIAIEWMKKYEHIPNTAVAFNNLRTAKDFQGILNPLYLPNVYEAEFHEGSNTKEIINLGCFGAIRTLKNQLTQAVAAIKFGDKYGRQIRFHVNGSRIENSSVGVLKNLRSLFAGTCHQLVEHKWMDHQEFLKVVRKMDLGLQVSFTESFNIISADFIYSGVPIIVSDEISWMNNDLKVNSTNVDEIVKRIAKVLKRKPAYLKKAQQSLKRYNGIALSVWDEFLQIL